MARAEGGPSRLSGLSAVRSEPTISVVATLREKNPLPAGALPVAVGLAINGAATYAFLGIASRALDGADYSALSNFWALLFGLGNGAMQPLEQEVARSVSARRAQGIGAGPVVRQAAVIGGVFTVVLCVAIALGRGTLEERQFNGTGSLVPALMLGLAGFCVAHLARGTLSSHGRFRGYAVFFAGEGLYRLVLVGLLAFLGAKVLGPYGLVAAIAPFLAMGTAVLSERDLLDPGPDPDRGELTRNLGWLLLGAGSLSLLLQSGTIAVGWYATGIDSAAAGKFLSGLAIARVPLFLFQAVLASLLPKLSRLAAQGSYDEFHRGLRRLVAAILALGAVATLAAALLGPVAMRIVFKDSLALTGRDLAMMTAASVLMMAAICLDQALIALDAHSRMALGWVAAFATFVVAVALGSELFWRVELALVLSGTVALVWMYAFLNERLRHRPPARALSLAEADGSLVD